MRKLVMTCVLGISVLAMLTGCDQLTSVTNSNNTAPDAVIDAPTSVGIGETATLDGSGSSDAEGDNLTYSWEFTEKPAGSQTTITNPTNVQASFVPDARGNYKVQLTVSDGKDDGVALATISANVPEINTINQNTVLANVFTDPAEADYRVTGSVGVNAQLTIQPGVKIEFASGASLDVGSAGSLVAVGTQSDSIVFSGEQATPGFWDGLYINSNNPANELTYCVVEYGGDYYSNIYITNGSQLKVTHTTSRYSSGTGLHGSSDSKLPGFAVNRFAHNSGAAIDIPARLIGSIDAASVYSAGNAKNYIDVTPTNVTTEQTWPATDAPYRLQANTTDIEEKVTIQPGATLMFDSGADLSIGSSGQLVAVGTPTDSITFTGELKTEGYWDAIYVNSNNPGNELTYCNIKYAGNYYANIYITGNGQLKMTHSTSSYSSGDGLYAANDAKLPAFSNNKFANNQAAALQIPARLVGSIDGASNYLGNNSHDYIDVKPTSVNTAQTWPATDAPYRFQANSTDVEAQITIEPGATLMFADNAGLDIGSSGSLIAVGTSTDSITFTGEVQTAGYWDAVWVNSNNPSNELSYCNVGFAGNYYSNVFLTGSGQLKLNHSTIHNSSGYGVYLSNGSVITPTNPETDGSNVFYNNASGNVHAP